MDKLAQIVIMRVARNALVEARVSFAHPLDVQVSVCANQQTLAASIGEQLRLVSAWIYFQLRATVLRRAECRQSASRVQMMGASPVGGRVVCVGRVFVGRARIVIEIYVVYLAGGRSEWAARGRGRRRD